MTAAAGPAVLVTGVAGFLGSHLAERLLERGVEVRGVDAFTPYYARALKEANLRGLSARPGFRLIEADLAEADCAPLVAGTSTVFHLAAQPGVRASWGEDFAIYVRQNLLATQRLLEACARAGGIRVVFSSSSSVYGEIAVERATEDEPLRPVSPYGVTKVAGEKLVETYHREFGVETVALRYFTVCGPRQRPDMAFHRILAALHEGREFTLHGDGEQQRDFTAVEDAVEANLLAAERGRPGAAYNVGGGRPITLARAVAELEAVTGRTARVRRVPRPAGDPLRTAADLGRARDELGYEPKVPVEEALRREAAWYAGPAGPPAILGGEAR